MRQILIEIKTRFLIFARCTSAYASRSYSSHYPPAIWYLCIWEFSICLLIITRASHQCCLYHSTPLIGRKHSYSSLATIWFILYMLLVNMSISNVQKIPQWLNVIQGVKCMIWCDGWIMEYRTMSSIWQMMNDNFKLQCIKR